jgi:competence protein ComEC
MTRAEAVPVVALLALVSGILAGERAAISPPQASVALIGGVAALAASWFARTSARPYVLCGALALLGMATMARAVDGQQHAPLHAAIDRRARLTLAGTVVTDPSGPRFVVSALARVDVDGGTRIVLVSASGDDASYLRALQAGDGIVVTGRLAPLRKTAFDDRARWRHAVARLDDAELDDAAPPDGLYALADQLRTRVVRGTRALTPTDRALVTGFLLGDTRALPVDIEEEYRDAGLTHLLVVSGGNVAFVLALAGPLLRKLPLSGRTALALLIVLVFAAMTRFEPSVLRASAMAAVALLATFAGRPAPRVRVLAYAVIVVLVIDPFLLRSVGFLLSCGASAGIALVAPGLARRLPGPALIREPLAVSLAAQLGVLPVLLLVFDEVPLVTPVANLFAAPAAEILGTYGFVASAIAGIEPRLGALLHQPTTLLVRWVSGVAHVGASFPVRLDRRSTLACVTIGATIASIACLRARTGRRSRRLRRLRRFRRAQDAVATADTAPR